MKFLLLFSRPNPPFEQGSRRVRVADEWRDPIRQERSEDTLVRKIFLKAEAFCAFFHPEYSRFNGIPPLIALNATHCRDTSCITKIPDGNSVGKGRGLSYERRYILRKFPSL